MIKKQLLGFLFIISLVLSLSAQTAKPDELEKKLKNHVYYLTSDKLEGRRAGENGSTFAAGYVANMFAKYRLKAGFRNQKGKTAFLQPFPYISGVKLGKSNELKLVLDKSEPENRMEVGVNWIPFAASPDIAISTGNIVFANYGIVAEEAKINDYKDLDVRGRILLIFDGVPENVGSVSSLSRFTIHAKAKIAKDNGAVGLIIVSKEKDVRNDRLIKLNYDSSQGETAVPTVVVSRSSELEKLLGKTSQVIANSTVSLKVDLEKTQSEVYNVVGVLEGNDAVLKNEAVVIGAHYDHLGRGGQGSLAVNSTEIHYGADDNASGTAALLEIAHYFAKTKNNKRTLIFMAFGAEESGLIGSKHYVNNPTFPLENIVSMFNMDMVGRLRDDKLTVGGIGTAEEWKNLVNGKNEIIPSVYSEGKGDSQKRETVYRFQLQLSEDGFGPSDHSSFYGKKIPVLFFFTGTHTDYHKPTDTAEKINFSGLKKIVEYVVDIAGYVGNMSKRPTYTVAKSSGQGDGRRGFNVTIGVVPGYGESNDGMLLDGVREGSPAAKAGLKAGDKIVKLAGKEVRNVQDYTVILGELKADTEYEVYVVRGTERLILKVTPTARK